MNNCVLCGNLTKDVELTSTTNGTAVGRFTLAVQRSYANENGEREADFINIVVWRGQAENCAKYLKKGSKALVTGELHIRSYEDKDGVKKYATEIVANQVEFVGQKASGDGENPPPSTQPNNQQGNVPDGLTPVGDDQSLPF